MCGPTLGDDTLHAYLLSGGSPVACNELAAAGRIHEYVIEMTRDWILGEFAASGRPRASLLGVIECLFRFGGTPVGQADGDADDGEAVHIGDVVKRVMAQIKRTSQAGVGRDVS